MQQPNTIVLIQALNEISRSCAAIPAIAGLGINEIVELRLGLGDPSR